MLNVLPDAMTDVPLLASVILPNPAVDNATEPAPPLPIGPFITRSPPFTKLSVAPGTIPRRPATIPALPFTDSATLLTKPTLPSAIRSCTVETALPPLPSTRLPTAPVKFATESDAPTDCVTAPLVCKSRVFGLVAFPVRKFTGPATPIALLPIAPLTAPIRTVAASSP